MNLDLVTIERCAQVAANESDHYTSLIAGGKGEHGQPGYVQDATWIGWHTKQRQSEYLASAIRALVSETQSSPIPVQGAEPSTSQADHGRAAVGRTEGANPSTGASSDGSPSPYLSKEELAAWCSRNQIFPSWSATRALLAQYDIRRRA